MTLLPQFYIEITHEHQCCHCYSANVSLKFRIKIPPCTYHYYNSHIQNELNSCCGDWIRERLLLEVVIAKFCSVCADEGAPTRSNYH